MIAIAHCVKQGINTLRYISGEDTTRKHRPDLIHRIADFFLPRDSDAMGIWLKMNAAACNHPKLKASLINIKLCPPQQYTAHFTQADWKQLWIDFAREFDAIEMRDANGKVFSPHTNISNSMATVWLHCDSKSGIPHLHIAVSRVDENDCVNNDHRIDLRAQQAAQMVARRRGWITAKDVRREIISAISADCMSVLKQMPQWSWQLYVSLLQSKGYEVKLRCNADGIVKGYTIRKGNSIYKASELGIGRKLNASRIYHTWQTLHTSSEETEHRGSVPAGVHKPSVDAHVPMQQRFDDYRDYRQGRVRTEIEVNGQKLQRFIPRDVIALLNDEFDYRSVANWQPLTNLALALFTMVVQPDVAPTVGGGGNTNDLKWGRDPREDELEWARRCAREARRQIPLQHRSSRRR